jgi:CheY-like chemotaxis protein
VRVRIATLSTPHGRGTVTTLFFALYCILLYINSMESQSSVQGSKKLTVLIIDDQDSCRLVMSALLHRQFDCSVIERNDPSDIVAVLGEYRPDIVVTDLLMPVMGGKDVLRVVQSMPDMSHVAVVAYSATITEANKPELLASGFSACIAKPFDFANLHTELTLIIDSLPMRISNVSST